MYVVIMGGGKVGEYLATVLLNSGNDVALIEKDLATADKLSIVLQGSYLVIHGDGCDSKYQEDAGIRRADVFVAATGQDDNNLVSCEIAQRVFSVPRCIARVNHPKNLRIFKEVGIECVSSTTLIANLIEEETLVVALATVEKLFDKTMANVREVKARGAHVLGVTTEDFAGEIEKYVDRSLIVPKTHPLLQPSLTVIPLQAFAYYIALARGCDVDMPRNLAKSVTVE